MTDKVQKNCHLGRVRPIASPPLLAKSVPVTLVVDVPDDGAYCFWELTSSENVKYLIYTIWYCSIDARDYGNTTMCYKNNGLAMWRIQVSRQHDEWLYSNVWFRRMQFGETSEACEHVVVTNRVFRNFISNDFVLCR